MTATFYGMCLTYLKKSRTGIDWTGEPRYRQLPKDKWATTKGYFGGYSSNDWVRAMLHYIYAVQRRVKVHPFGKSGVQYKEAKQYMVISSDDRDKKGQNLYMRCQ